MKKCRITVMRIAQYEDLMARAKAKIIAAWGAARRCWNVFPKRN